MDLINPHERVGSYQVVWWSDFPLNQQLTFELLDYFKSPVVVKGRGIYVVYFAISHDDIDSLGVKANDELILMVAYKGLINALNKLPNEQRVPCLKKYADGKNLLITFEKLNSKIIRVRKQEIKQPTEEQLVEAARQYGIIKRENGNG